MATERFRKVLHPEVAKALNDHISVEATAAFIYYSVASWASVRGLTGFASYFRSEAAGELDHMRQFVAYLNDRDFQATFNALEAPPSEFEGPEEIMEMVCEQEHRLCEAMDQLIELALSHRDHLTESFLNQFIPQQIADTAGADDLLDRVQLVGKEGQGILMIDQELGRAEG